MRPHGLLLGLALSAQDVRLDFLSTIEAPGGVMCFGRRVQVIDDANGGTFPDGAVAVSSAGGGVVFLFSGFDDSLLSSFQSPKEAPSIDFEPKDTFPGRAHLFNGATGALMPTDINPTELSGEAATLGTFGQFVATPSGQFEVYVGEPGANFSTNTFVNSGRVYKYQGLNQTFLLANPLRVGANARFGENMSVVPNLDRDSGFLAGVIIGIPNSSPEDSTQRLGRAHALDFEEINRVNDVYVSPTPQTNSVFGAAVAGILDVSGDTRGELPVSQQRLGTDPQGELTDQAGVITVTQPVILDVLDVTNDGLIDSRDLDALRVIVFGPGDPFPSGWVVR
jgi:hypothetical protein